MLRCLLANGNGQFICIYAMKEWPSRPRTFALAPSPTLGFFVVMFSGPHSLHPTLFLEQTDVFWVCLQILSLCLDFFGYKCVYASVCVQMNAVKRLFKITVKYNILWETFSNAQAQAQAQTYITLVCQSFECRRHSTTNTQTHTVTTTHNRNKLLYMKEVTQQQCNERAELDKNMTHTQPLSLTIKNS